MGARKDLGFDGPIPSAENTARHEWTDAERTRAMGRSKAIITGTSDEVHTELTALAESHCAHEVMINTLTSDPADRLTSYRLLAERLME